MNDPPTIPSPGRRAAALAAAASARDQYAAQFLAALIGEWACHPACARFALVACPILAHQGARRGGREYPAGTEKPAGALDHIPPLVAAWTIGARGKITVVAGELFRPSAPIALDWWAAGQQLTHAEALPLLTDYLAPRGFDAVDVQAVLTGSEVSHAPR